MVNDLTAQTCFLCIPISVADLGQGVHFFIGFPAAPPHVNRSLVDIEIVMFSRSWLMKYVLSLFSQKQMLTQLIKVYF